MATLVVYLLGIIVWLVKVTPSHSTSNDGLLKFCIGFLLISAGIFVLTGICFAKGEKPSWNWANKKNKENNHE